MFRIEARPALLMRSRARRYAGRMSDSDPHHRIDLLRKEMETMQAPLNPPRCPL